MCRDLEKRSPKPKGVSGDESKKLENKGDMDWQEWLKPFSKNLILNNCYKCYHKEKSEAF